MNFKKILQPMLLCPQWLFTALLVAIGIFITSFCFGTTLFTDDFETYELGNLAGQGGWEKISGGEPQVVDSFSFHGNNSVYTASSQLFKKKVGETGSGQITFYIYLNNSTHQIYPTLGYYTEVGADNSEGWGIYNGKMYYYSDGWIPFADITYQEWHYLTIEWNTIDDKMKITLDGTTSSPYYYRDIRGAHTLLFNNMANTMYIDYIAENPYSPPLEIIAIDPISGSVITDLTDIITIEYHSFDWNTYKGFVVNFKDNKIGAVGNSIQFLADDLDPSGTGQVEISLQDFGFDSNGQWYFTGLGFGSHLDIEGGMFLTTRGYIDFWTDDLVLTPYYLTINVEGLPTPYTFTTAEDWYGVNVLRFDSPTDFFVSFVGLLSPVFEKIGEFGVRIQNYFDENEAYDRGYSLGEIFPIARAYIEKIDMFFGGFPLATFFTYLILIMLAIFLIRIIMKFIPFFG